MGKYQKFTKTQFSSLSVYRVEAYGRWIMALFSALSYYYIWKLTVNSDAESYKYLVYFVLYWCFLSSLTSGKTAYFIAKDVRSGEINNYLVKPINYFKILLIRGLTPVIFRIVIPSILLLLFSLLFPSIFMPISLVNFIIFVFSLIFCFLIWSFIMIIIGSIAFTGTEIRNTLTVFDLVINLLRGAYIPAFLFPDWLDKFLFYTFVPYISAFSIKLYQEVIPTDQLIRTLFMTGVWTLALLLISQKVLQKGIRFYETNGS